MEVQSVLPGLLACAVSAPSQQLLQEVCLKMAESCSPDCVRSSLVLLVLRVLDNSVIFRERVLRACRCICLC